jgi:DNA processing protein
VSGRDPTDAVAADGTDPARLTRVLAWLLGPRRNGEMLRRRCRDHAEGPPGDRLHAVLPAPTRTERDAVTSVTATWRRLGVSVALVGDPAYPSVLAAGWPDTDGPVLLAWSGQAPGTHPAVGLVGARQATGYGTGVASWLAATVARAGGHVVSGGARGVDAAAHLASLEEPGGTTVVLGCGHAVDYPRAHAVPGGLFDRITDHGGTVASELLPHEPPHARNVRQRNRVVAGLVGALVVVEGGPRSGALVTAGAAADRGVSVLAVPGDVRAPGSVAPHRLLAEGAAPCRGPQDILEALGAATPGAPRPPGGRQRAATGSGPDGGEGTLGLPGDVAALLRAAWPRPVRVDDLASATSRSVPALLAALTQARVAGVIAESVEGVRLRRAP